MNKETMIGILRGKYKFTSVTETQCALNDIAEWIDHAEKVVRCKDCKYSRPIDTRNREEKDAADGTCVCCSCEISEVPSVVWEDDFCSYGKVKT